MLSITSLKQHSEYPHFQCKIQLDLSVYLETLVFLPTSEYAWETIAKMADAVIKKMTQAKQVIAAFQTPVAEHRRLVTVRSEPEGSEVGNGRFRSHDS